MSCSSPRSPIAPELPPWPIRSETHRTFEDVDGRVVPLLEGDLEFRRVVAEDLSAIARAAAVLVCFRVRTPCEQTPNAV
jgi:hypothetical protein